MNTTDDTQTDHATEKCVVIGGVACRAREVSPKNDYDVYTSHKLVVVLRRFTISPVSEGTKLAEVRLKNAYYLSSPETDRVQANADT